MNNTTGGFGWMTPYMVGPEMPRPAMTAKGHYGPGGVYWPGPITAAGHHSPSGAYHAGPMPSTTGFPAWGPNPTVMFGPGKSPVPMPMMPPPPAQMELFALADHLSMGLEKLNHLMFGLSTIPEMQPVINDIKQRLLSSLVPVQEQAIQGVTQETEKYEQNLALAQATAEAAQAIVETADALKQTLAQTTQQLPPQTQQTIQAIQQAADSAVKTAQLAQSALQAGDAASIEAAHGAVELMRQQTQQAATQILQ